MLRIALRIAVCCSAFTFAFAQSATNRTYEKLDAILWMQTSVEYRALTLQTYRAAEAALLRGLQNKRWTAALEQTGNFEALPPAVVLDLDNTVLDVSAFEARRIVSGEPQSEQAWAKWVSEESAGLVPGAREFAQFAQAHGVEPIYLTDRNCDSSDHNDATAGVLRKLQLPLDQVSDQLVCAQSVDGNDKTARRTKVAAKYRILLLIGDSLNDFLQIPAASANLQGREKLFAAHQNLWGERWFQLPDPVYGGWEAAVGANVNEKLSKLRK